MFPNYFHKFGAFGIAIDIEYFELQDSLFSVGYLNELSSSLNNCQAPE